MQSIRSIGLAAIGLSLPLFFLRLGDWMLMVPPELFVFGHVAFFLLLTSVLLFLPPWGSWPYPTRAATAVAIATLAGAVIELIQPSFGRSAELADLWQNFLGSLAAVAIFAPRGVVRWVLRLLATALLVLELYQPSVTLWDRAVARAQFPVLAQFDTRYEHQRWSAGTPDDSVAAVGSRSLRVTLRDGRRYPGTTLRRSLGDWSGHDTLQLSIYLPDDEPLQVTLSIRDRDHFPRGGAFHDRFNRNFELEQGWNTLEIPIDEIRNAPRDRTMDLAALTEMAVFTTGLERERVIFVDAVRLKR